GMLRGAFPHDEVVISNGCPEVIVPFSIIIATPVFLFPAFFMRRFLFLDVPIRALPKLSFLGVTLSFPVTGVGVEVGVAGPVEVAVGVPVGVTPGLPDAVGVAVGVLPGLPDAVGVAPPDGPSLET